MSDDQKKTERMSDKYDADKIDTKDKRFMSVTVDVNGAKSSDQDLISQILGTLKKSQDDAAIKVAFDQDPTTVSRFSGLYKNRGTGIPNDMLKRVRDSEEMIGGVVSPTRARQVSLFGHARANRFDIGFTVNIKPHVYANMNSEEAEELRSKETPKIKEMLLNCGLRSGITDRDKLTLSEFLYEIIEDGLTFGWFTVEVRRNVEGNFHSFRPADAGTIYQYATPTGNDSEVQRIRADAKKLLAQLEGKPSDLDTKIEKDEVTWVQVINGSPRQVFTDNELLVYNLYPSTDIKRNGYPTSPIERILNAVITHINITTHNKLFFLNGRAARNVLVFQSENLDVEDIKGIRSQMQAHINSANASWRMPVFGVGQNDKVNVLPLDGAGRDMEFQYLADLTKRIIFAAYQMSPDEVPALSYLSRGTASQSLSEGNNEFKLEAARDLGLRPLIMSIESFINERLLPQINKDWAEKFYISFEGLDADTPEKEATRIQQDSAIYLTMDEIMSRVEKKPVPIGGKFPLNTAYLQVIEKYFTKGQILAAFGGSGFKDCADAQKHPEYDYYMGDPASQWYLNLKYSPQQQGKLPPGQSGGGQPTSEQSGQQDQGQSGQEQPDMSTMVDQLSSLLTKSEKDLPMARKALLVKHKEIKNSLMNAWEKESKEMFDQIMSAIEGKKDDGHNH